MSFWRKKIDVLKGEIGEIETKLKALAKEKGEFEKQARSIRRQKRPSSTGDKKRRDSDERYKFDTATAARIREVISDVLVAPAGTNPRHEERITLIDAADLSPDSKAALKRVVGDLNDTPFFAVKYADGSELIAVPNKNDASDVPFYYSKLGSIVRTGDTQSGNFPPVKVPTANPLRAPELGVSGKLPGEVPDDGNRCQAGMLFQGRGKKVTYAGVEVRPKTQSGE
jgi:hypothetical protein